MRGDVDWPWAAPGIFKLLDSAFQPWGPLGYMGMPSSSGSTSCTSDCFPFLNFYFGLSRQGVWTAGVNILERKAPRSPDMTKSKAVEVPQVNFGNFFWPTSSLKWWKFAGCTVTHECQNFRMRLLVWLVAWLTCFLAIDKPSPAQTMLWIWIPNLLLKPQTARDNRKRSLVLIQHLTMKVVVCKMVLQPGRSLIAQPMKNSETLKDVFSRKANVFLHECIVY